MRETMRMLVMPAVAMMAMGCAPEGAAFETTGTVRRSAGASALPEGAACTVGIANESRGGYPCRVSVTCEGRPLYGGAMLGGYARCAAEEGRWVRATDDELEHLDGDPWMSFDVRAGTVIVRTRQLETLIEVDTEQPRVLASR
ncbi:MAG: hypothetical protein M5U28_13725 [Sandaracinaceae bacterium]|nr:hypothetical protein [Sandaracinaceae bacterium]